MQMQQAWPGLATVICWGDGPMGIHYPVFSAFECLKISIVKFKTQNDEHFYKIFHKLYPKHYHSLEEMET